MTALQIRDLPEDVHRTLKSRAAQRGMSLSEYASQILRRDAETPTVEELTARIRTRGSAQVGDADIAAVIRRDRDSR